MPSEANEILQDLEGILKGAADAVLEGSKKDIELFAQSLTEDLTAASLLGDQETVDNILAQAQAIAELSQVRANDQAWSVFMSIASRATNLISIIVRISTGVI